MISPRKYLWITMYNPFDTTTLRWYILTILYYRRVSPMLNKVLMTSHSLVAAIVVFACYCSLMDIPRILIVVTWAFLGLTIVLLSRGIENLIYESFSKTLYMWFERYLSEGTK